MQMTEVDDIEFQRYCTALHELGHVYVAWEFGVNEISEITINGGIRGGGGTWLNTQNNFAGVIASIMAGEIIEQLVFGRAEEGSCKTDRAQIVEYCRSIPGWSENDPRLEILRRMTTRILRHNLWDLIKEAHKLAEPGKYKVQWGGVSEVIQ
jgi:hypothetical protein